MTIYALRTSLTEEKPHFYSGGVYSSFKDERFFVGAGYSQPTIIDTISQAYFNAICDREIRRVADKMRVSTPSLVGSSRASVPA